MSDHNPDGRGVVHACDVTHDPAHGFDAWAQANVIANRIKAGLEHRVKYLVANDGHGADQIFNPAVSLSWRQNGSYKTDHRSHLHISILYTVAAENDITPFFVGGTVSVPQPVPQHVPVPSGPPTLSQGAHGSSVKLVQQLLVNNGLRVAVDGDFGPATRSAVVNFQRARNLTADGIVGPKTWAALSAQLPKTPGPAPAPVVPHGAPPTIQLGARGDVVRVLQALLHNKGYSLVADGIFGPATKAAVKAFQRSRALEADGIVGPRTWAAVSS